MDIQAINRRVIEQFRAGGPIEGMHREGILLLTTTGRRTGQSRTTPMMFDRDGEDLLVIASNIGAPRHPDWYLNLVSEPRVVVEVGTARFEAIATPTSGVRRERLWSWLKQKYPFFAEHEAKTSREIPVVALIPAEAGDDL
jgi:deazaflavin-dependent oxidoreductase (nitroreductase family)